MVDNIKLMFVRKMPKNITREV